MNQKEEELSQKRERNNDEDEHESLLISLKSPTLSQRKQMTRVAGVAQVKLQ